MNHIHRKISNVGTVLPDRALWAMDGLWGLCLVLLLHGPSSAQDWQHNNRNLSLHASRTAQRYSEQDTQLLTADGVLDSEAGHPTGWGAQARWQGELDALGALPLWLQAGAERSSGQTDYNGYLQNGTTLTPYRAKTGNTWQSESLRVGLPLTADNWPQWQFIPYADWTHQRWQRHLVQYSETYTQRRQSLGLLVQWQPDWPDLTGRPEEGRKPWLVELGHQRSVSQQGRVNAPMLDFAAIQPLGPTQQTELRVRYAISPRWHLKLQAQSQRTNTTASAVVNGLQSPPSQTRQTQLGMGLDWTY